MLLLRKSLNYVYSRIEQDKLVSMMAETYGSFYIGLKYNDPSQVFEWASGEAVTYTDAWEHYQPGKALYIAAVQSVCS